MANEQQDSFEAFPAVSEQNPSPTYPSPAGSLGSMTRAEWRDAILEDLGGEGVDVELSEKQIDFCVKRALGLWAKHRPLLCWFPFVIPASETCVIDFFSEKLRSDPNADPRTFVRRVLDVQFQDHDRRVLGARSGFLAGYYLRWGYQGPRLFYELHVGERLYERLTGSRPDWWWDDVQRRLFISVPSRDVKIMALASRPRLLEEIPPDHEEDFLKAAVARAKRISARVLGARGPIPGAGGEVRTDAAELRREAKEEWDEVAEKLERSLSAVPPPRYIG